MPKVKQQPIKQPQKKPITKRIDADAAGFRVDQTTRTLQDAATALEALVDLGLPKFDKTLKAKFRTKAPDMMTAIDQIRAALEDLDRANPQ